MGVEASITIAFVFGYENSEKEQYIIVGYCSFRVHSDNQDHLGSVEAVLGSIDDLPLLIYVRYGMDFLPLSHDLEGLYKRRNLIQ